jgi:hypothetical protein
MEDDRDQRITSRPAVHLDGSCYMTHTGECQGQVLVIRVPAGNIGYVIRLCAAHRIDLRRASK